MLFNLRCGDQVAKWVQNVERKKAATTDDDHVWWYLSFSFCTKTADFATQNEEFNTSSTKPPTAYWPTNHLTKLKLKLLIVSSVFNHFLEFYGICPFSLWSSLSSLASSLSSWTARQVDHNGFHMLRVALNVGSAGLGAVPKCGPLTTLQQAN